jgi:hypothetical protein
VITLEQLHFADEIRPFKEIKPSRARVSQQELQMAQRLIESQAQVGSSAVGQVGCRREARNGAVPAFSVRQVPTRPFASRPSSNRSS